MLGKGSPLNLVLCSGTFIRLPLPSAGEKESPGSCTEREEGLFYLFPGLWEGGDEGEGISHYLRGLTDKDYVYSPGCCSR